MATDKHLTIGTTQASIGADRTQLDPITLDIKF